MQTWRDIVARVPAIGRLRQQRDGLAAEVAQLATTSERLRVERDLLADRLGVAALNPAYLLYPPGHFYSPQPNLDEVAADADRIWPNRIWPEVADIAGIDLRVAAQLELLESLAGEMSWWPYDPATSPGRPRRWARGGLRYTVENDFFGHTDGQVLTAMLRHLRPQRYLEIGSGWSSALVLDLLDATRELTCEVVFVEPYPDRLRALLRPGDLDRAELLEQRAQDLDLARIDELEAGDVLFVDSTHVSKIGSDVNWLVFDALPRLASGVVVHIHDVAFPFEYSPSWVNEGRAWNEAYLVRAMLMENPRWEILLWPSMLWGQRPERMRAALGPHARVDAASLWLVRR